MLKTTLVYIYILAEASVQIVANVCVWLGWREATSHHPNVEIYKQEHVYDY